MSYINSCLAMRCIACDDDIQGESKLGRLVDALAPGGDEGRDKLR